MSEEDLKDPRSYDIALVLSDGNALGAFHGGVYQSLQEQRLEAAIFESDVRLNQRSRNPVQNPTLRKRQVSKGAAG